MNIILTFSNYIIILIIKEEYFFLFFGYNAGLSNTLSFQ